MIYVRCHACILTWFCNIGPIIFFYFMKLSLDMSLLLKSYAGFVFHAASFYLSYLWEEVFDFLQVSFFQKCMICHCLLCHALVKCFSFIVFKSMVFRPFQTRRTFHETSLIALVWGCDPSLGFYKEEIHSADSNLFSEWWDNENKFFTFQKCTLLGLKNNFLF